MSENERPLLFANNRVYSPNTLDMALLKRSSSNIRLFSFSEYFIPSDRDTQKLIYQLSQESKQLLNLVSNDISKLLNKQVIKDEFKLKLG